MADIVSIERRSEIMSHIKSKNTSIELLVRKFLFSRGYRYRVNYKPLPGKPDIVFTKKRIVIFIHGCYWHGHNCKSRFAHTSKSNSEYWNAKITRTQERDKTHVSSLEQEGWKVLTLWECEIKNNFEDTMEQLTTHLV